jgi:hypothetical protein
MPANFKFTTIDQFVKDCELINLDTSQTAAIRGMMNDLHLEIQRLSFTVAGFIYIWRTQYVSHYPAEPVLPSDTSGTIALVRGHYGMAVCFEDEHDAALFKLMQGDD